MRRVIFGFAVGLFVGAAIHSVGAQNARISGMNLNHVLIRVPNVDEASRFYGDKFGFKEAFAVRNQDGTPAFTYLQVSQNTFLELQPANANNPPGIGHIGLEVGNTKDVVLQLKMRGLQPRDANRSQRTGAILSTVQGTLGVSFELLEFPSGSLGRKAMDSWR